MVTKQQSRKSEFPTALLILGGVFIAVIGSSFLVRGCESSDKGEGTSTSSSVETSSTGDTTSTSGQLETTGGSTTLPESVADSGSSGEMLDDADVTVLDEPGLDSAVSSDSTR